MSEEEKYFVFVGGAIDDATKGQFLQEAMSLDGLELFDPSGKNRPMKE